MVTKKDLVEYLVDYLEQEADSRIDGNINLEDMPEILEQGLDAFESTKNVELIVKENE